MNARSRLSPRSIFVACVLIMVLAAASAAVVADEVALGGGLIAVTTIVVLVLVLRRRRGHTVRSWQVETGYGVAFSVLGAAALITGATGPGVVMVLCAVWIWYFTRHAGQAP